MHSLYAIKGFKPIIFFFFITFLSLHMKVIIFIKSDIIAAFIVMAISNCCLPTIPKYMLKSHWSSHLIVPYIVLCIYVNYIIVNSVHIFFNMNKAFVNRFFVSYPQLYKNDESSCWYLLEMYMIQKMTCFKTSTRFYNLL